MEFYTLNVVYIASIIALAVSGAQAWMVWGIPGYPKILILVLGSLAFVLTCVEGAIAYPVFVLLQKWILLVYWVPPLVGFYTIIVLAHRLTERLEPSFGYIRP